MNEENKKSNKSNRKLIPTFSSFMGWIDSLLRKKVILVLLIILPFVVLLGFAGLYEYSTTPKFCQGCHIMKPYYMSWKNSAHKSVACVKCHYPPGTRNVLKAKIQATVQVVKFATNTYSYNSKPYAEVPDSSCLRKGCHSLSLLSGRIIFGKGIKFDHSKHINHEVRGRVTRCTTCHTQIMVGRHMEIATNRCFLCHFKDKKEDRTLTPVGGCTACHEAPKKPIRIMEISYNHKDFVGKSGVKCQNCHFDSVVGDGEAPQERCLNCHNRQDNINKYTNVRDIHKTHTTIHNVSCFQCHNEIRHEITTLPLSITSIDCQSCHQKLHNEISLFYSGRGGKDVPDLPSPMYLAQVDCISCHRNPQKDNLHPFGVTFKASEAACLTCHNEKYKGMLTEWKTDINKGLYEFRPKLDEARKKFSEISQRRKVTEEAKKLFENAMNNFDFVAKSKVYHNIYYAARILQAANQDLDKLGNLLGYKPMQMDKNSLVNGGFCATLCHKRLAVRFIEDTWFNGIFFPHARHFSQYRVGCINCHSFGNHKEVMVKLDKGGCKSCHHAPSTIAKGCSSCHSLQDNFYKGKVKGNGLDDITPTPIPNIMAGTVDCQGCHNLAKKHSFKMVSEACITCHDKNYEAILSDWDRGIKGSMNQLRALIAKGEKNIETLSKTKGIQAAKIREDLEKARAAYNLVERTKGVHNPPLAEKIISLAADRLKKDLGDQKAR